MRALRKFSLGIALCSSFATSQAMALTITPSDVTSVQNLYMPANLSVNNTSNMNVLSGASQLTVNGMGSNIYEFCVELFVGGIYRSYDVTPLSGHFSSLQRDRIKLLATLMQRAVLRAQMSCGTSANDSVAIRWRSCSGSRTYREESSFPTISVSCVSWFMCRDT